MKKPCIYNEITVILHPNNNRYEETIYHTGGHCHRDRLYRTTALPNKAGMGNDRRQARLGKSHSGKSLYGLSDGG